MSLFYPGAVEFASIQQVDCFLHIFFSPFSVLKVGINLQGNNSIGSSTLGARHGPRL